jgi:hypothetical protein
MNQLVFGYLVFVNSEKQGQTEADIARLADEQNGKDPDEFKYNTIEWLTMEEMFAVNDWKSIWIASKVLFEINKQIEEKLEKME